MNYEIVTDSSSNLPDEIIDKYRLHILSLIYRIGDKEYESYIANQNNDLTEFYRRMRLKESITTSCMSPGTCRKMFDKILKSGKDLIYIGFSSALSAAYQTAQTALDELRKEYPDRKIYSIDTLGASLGEGLLVTIAAQLKERGASIDEVYNWLLDTRLHLCHWFTVDDLNYLNRGGRISASSAFLGTILSIKPILHMDNSGHLIPVSKVRSRKNALQFLVDKMEQSAIHPESQTVYISHADCKDDAYLLAQMIREKFQVKDILIHMIEPVIGAHCGPGTIALFFLGTER